MSRENPKTDEMLRLIRVREKTRRALARATTAMKKSADAFAAANDACVKFETALQRQMMVEAGLEQSAPAEQPVPPPAAAPRRNPRDPQTGQLLFAGLPETP